MYCAYPLSLLFSLSYAHTVRHATPIFFFKFNIRKGKILGEGKVKKQKVKKKRKKEKEKKKGKKDHSKSKASRSFPADEFLKFISFWTSPLPPLKKKSPISSSSSSSSSKYLKKSIQQVCESEREREREMLCLTQRERIKKSLFFSRHLVLWSSAITFAPVSSNLNDSLRERERDSCVYRGAKTITSVWGWLLLLMCPAEMDGGGQEVRTLYIFFFTRVGTCIELSVRDNTLVVALFASVYNLTPECVTWRCMPSLSLSLSLYMHSSPMSPHLPLVVLLHADDPHPPPLWGNNKKKQNNNFHGRNSIPFTPTPFFHALF